MLDLETGARAADRARPAADRGRPADARAAERRASAPIELLKSQARGSTPATGSRRGAAAPTSSCVFEAAGGEELDTVRVPYFFTYDGFHAPFIDRLGDIGEQVEEASAGCSARRASRRRCRAVRQSARRDARALHARLHRRLAASARQAALAQAARRQAAIRRAQRALGADLADQAAAGIDPRRDALTRERPRSRRRAAGAPRRGRRPATKPPARPVQVAGSGAARRRASRRSSSRSMSLVEGDRQRQPVDALISNLNQIARTSSLLAQSGRRRRGQCRALQQLIAALENNASRMPPPFSDMMRVAVGEFEGDVAGADRGQICSCSARSGAARTASRPSPTAILSCAAATRTCRSRISPPVRARRHHGQVLQAESRAACRHLEAAMGLARRTRR